VPFEKVTLAGVGLLGGSLALAIRHAGLARSVAGYVRRDAAIGECEKVGLTGFATTDLSAAVEGADLVVLCTPLAQMRALVERMLPTLRAGAIVSDVGSVKGPVVEELTPLVAQGGAEFIGAHPMAGAEKMGVSAARHDIFRNAVCVTTPSAASSAAAVSKLESLWRAVGSRVIRLEPLLHDQLVARCSHLPHVIAAQLATCVLNPALPKEQPELCATGFRDTTRIASGSPEMWRDISVANRENLAQVLGEFIQDLEEVRTAVKAGDGAALQRFFEFAKQQRDAWCAQAASPSPE
jgi:prephenate dehydrogenase